MPLSEKRPNVQEAEPGRNKKRTLDAFLISVPKPKEKIVAEPSADVDTPNPDKENRFGTSLNSTDSLSPESSPGLTESGSSPLDVKSPSPNQTPTKLSEHLVNPGVMTPASQQAPSGEPPAKRKRLSAEDKEQKAQEKAASEKSKAEDREKKKREKEEADKIKAEEKAAKAAAKAERDAAKAEKEAEKKQASEERAQKKRKKEEEAEKKARSQMRLTSMFTKATTVTPKKAAAIQVPTNEDAAHASPAGTPSKANADSKAISPYEQVFKPFFLKDHVRLAPTVAQWDEETLHVKSKIIDEYVQGKRDDITVENYSWTEALQLPFKSIRGRVYPSVKKIMADLNGDDSSAPIGLTTESQNDQIRLTREALKLIPLKTLKFHEDVRPPYIGTVSGLPAGVTSLRRLARNPSSRNILPLNYDYDSEGEWQEEDGEDVDFDEDEDDVDNDEDMGDFLDDSEDAGLVRDTFSSSIEPESSGICWENHNRLGPLPRMYKFRLEFMNETLEHHHGIDPFSTEYWESPSKPTRGNDALASAAPRPGAIPLALNGPVSSTSAPNSSAPMAPPPPPTDAFQALTQTGNGANAAAARLPKEKEEELKAFVRTKTQGNANMGKVTIVELFVNEPGNERLRKTHIRNSLDRLMVKTGPRKWVLKADS